MLILGLLLVLIGWLTDIGILTTIGIVLLVIGAVLWILGAPGRRPSVLVVTYRSDWDRWALASS